MPDGHSWAMGYVFAGRNVLGQNTSLFKIKKIKKMVFPLVTEPPFNFIISYKNIRPIYRIFEMYQHNQQTKSQ